MPHRIGASGVVLVFGLLCSTTVATALANAPAHPPVDASARASWTLGSNASTGTTAPPINVGAVFQNTANFLGTGMQQGPAGNVTGPAGTNVPTDHLLADDLHLVPSPSNTPVAEFTFSIANFNAVSLSARPHVSFYEDSGSNSPGLVLNTYLFNPTIVSGNSVQLFTYAIPLADQFVIPANNFIWAGVTFDNAGGSTATTAQLEKFGQGFFDPPTVGTSSGGFFFSTNPDDGYGSNPPVVPGISNPGPSTGNFGWGISIPVPEPACIGLIALTSATVLFGRQRRR